MAQTTGSRAVTSLGVVAAAGLATLAYGALVERKRFTVRHEVMPILDPGARALTVLHLSDLHMAPWQEDKQERIRSLSVFEPDLIIDTGDNLGHANGLPGVERAFEPFVGIPGVFVHGSNDYFGPVMKNPLKYLRNSGPSKRDSRTTDLDTPALERYFEDTLGWLSLNNAARAMLIKGSRLEFFGTNDAHRQWDRLDRLPAVIDDMRENVTWSDGPVGPEVVSIGVTHAPYRRVLDAFVTYGADAIFAGHTHGGQIRVPGLPALVANCDIPREQAQGMSTWTHAQRTALLNVSAGLGTSIYAPVRVASPPEAIVVTLTPRVIGYP